MTMLYGRRLSVCLSALSLLACASRAPEVAEVPTLELIGISKTLTPLDATTLDVSELDNGMVCERRIPTGSRIASKWCYTREVYETREAAKDDILRQDFEEMRQQQQARQMAEQARRQASMGR
jgi:hypothetical protein